MTQEYALALLKSGKNVFLTGQAGSGKTYVIKKYIEYLHEKNIPVAITASTGIAATHIGGGTIHSWSGMGIKLSLTSAQLAVLRSQPANKKKFQQVKVLILDEISMLHQRQLDLLDEILRYVKDQPFSPFGGVQMVLSGDFLQLPPVSRTREPSRDRFCFMSPTWVNAAFEICYLQTQYRQGDQVLTAILNEIRAQSVSEDTYALLQQKVNQFSVDEETIRTKLYTHNADVDAVNQQFLQQLNTKEKTYQAKTTGKKAVITKMESNSMISFELTLKIGAKVMFIKNDMQEEYVNGTTGIVEDFSKRGWPMVKTKDETIEAIPADWNVEDETGNVIATVSQVPLKLAWAVTIHKSQGMTLDEAEIDLSRTFEPGQGYVALSRLKDFEGLFLRGINEKALQLDKLAFKADLRFRELSKQAVNAYSLDELAVFQEQFCKLHARSSSSHSKQPKQNKENTYEITCKLLKQKKTIDEIAKERQLSAKTIYKHLEKIKIEYPSIDISHLKPDNRLIEQVDKAIQSCFPTQESRKEFRLKAIYEQLSESISYEDIRLSMLFIDL